MKKLCRIKQCMERHTKHIWEALMVCVLKCDKENWLAHMLGNIRVTYFYVNEHLPLFTP
jgi:hypothetical protein